MFDWLLSLDVSVFRFINQTLSNSFFNTIMPWFGDPPGFGFIVFALFLYLMIKGGAKGRIFAVVLLIGVGFCDGVVCNTIKHAVGRLRPFNDILDANVLMGRGSSFSMPSSHAGNWFAATLISFLFYRRSLRFMLPLAIIVSFSRVYTGVHYPSDVLAGALLGAGTGIAVPWALNSLWQLIGARWFPIWHSQQPTLFSNPVTSPSPSQNPQSAIRNPQLEWLRLGYILIGLLFLVRIGYLASGLIELSEDEGYQWLWSKHIDLSYYSKPPLIAYTQYLGTHLWGDTMFGVRFFSPVIAALLSLLLLRFLAREFSAKAGVLLVVIVSATPLLAGGSTLMTIDPLSVLFWTAAMIVGWRASQNDGTTRQWLWVGFWMGMGFLSKYTGLFQLLCWAVFFALWAPARKHLRRPGPYLALMVNLLCATPVLVWNAQHDWITVTHVAGDARLNEEWHFGWFKFMKEFVGSEFGVLNPVFFVGMVWAAIAFLMGRKNASKTAQPYYPLQVFLFSMGAPLFLFYFLYTLHSRVLPNWIAPSILPLFCLMLLHFGIRWKKVRGYVKPWLIFGIGLGLFAVVMVHETSLLGRIVHRPIPSKLDFLHRARGWEAIADEVESARAKLEAKEGKTTFVIGGHYGITSLVTFYLPEAKKRAQTGAEPLVYCRAAAHPENQFYFWPGYENRLGQNAIFVVRADQPSFTKDWFEKWWSGSLDYYKPAVNGPAPDDMVAEFETVTDLGIKDIFYNGRLIQRIQLFECKNFKNPLATHKN